MLGMPGTTSIAAGGSLLFESGSSPVDGAVSNSGTIHVFSGVPLVSVAFHGSVTNGGTILFDAGGPSGPGAMGTFGGTVSNTGTIHLFSGASAMFGAAVT